MSPFDVQSAPLSLYDLTWYHDTFLWHHWYHWDNLSSPSSHLIEPCWHTVNSYIFGKIYGPNLSGHKSGPGPLMTNSYGQFTVWVSVSTILKSRGKVSISFSNWEAEAPGIDPGSWFRKVFVAMTSVWKICPARRTIWKYEFSLDLKELSFWNHLHFYLSFPFLKRKWIGLGAKKWPMASWP